jgi:hypothetical protein
MAKAATGMRLEVDQVFLSFNVMIISMALSILASCWVLMDFQSAVISSVILVTCSCYWWIACRRIVNRFQYTIAHLDINFDQDGNDENEHRSNEQDSYAVAETRDHITRDNDIASGGMGGSTLQEPLVTEPKKSKGFSLFSGLRSSHAPPAHESSSNTSPVRNAHLMEAPVILPDNVAVTEGYVTYNEEIVNGKEFWRRRYCVIGKHGGLFFYESKTRFHEAPGKPLMARPIDLRSYKVSVIVGPDLFEVQLTSLTNKSSDGQNDLRNWALRYDSNEELDMWVESFQRVTGTYRL